MAELNASAGRSGRRSSRNRIAARVDLTAMVDLAFLLITFFMMTTTFAKPKVMPVVMPDKDGPVSGPVAASRTMTVCLGKNNKVMWYLGEATNPVIKPAVVGYGKAGIRKAISDTRQYVQQKSGKPMMVLIKAADASKYENLVDAIDELEITKIDRYAIVDIAKPDIELLKQKGLY
jgi:biopolymer transport protein ExbD